MKDSTQYYSCFQAIGFKYQPAHPYIAAPTTSDVAVDAGGSSEMDAHSPASASGGDGGVVDDRNAAAGEKSTFESTSVPSSEVGRLQAARPRR